MKDQRYIYGILKSFDNYSNLALDKVYERVFIDGQYGEKNLGLISLRGESIILIGLSRFNSKSLKRGNYDNILKKLQEIQLEPKKI